jgi:hypothetical protein
LFVSENGIDFEPVTVDGFGDPCNYGGRVLVSSDHGLYVTTANPFNGGQVWRLSPMELGVYPNGPSEARLGKDDVLVMTVLVTDAPADSELALDYMSDLVNVRLVKRDTAKTVTDITWDNDIICIPFTDRKAYQISENATVHDTVMYDVVITPLKSGYQDLTLNFEICGVSAVKTIALTVDMGPVTPVVTGAVPSAYVEKLNGNQNRLYITVTETYSDGTMKNIEWNGLINNNTAGTYQVVSYKVYVDTKGNTQIRACYIVE